MGVVDGHRDAYDCFGRHAGGPSVKPFRGPSLTRYYIGELPTSVTDQTLPGDRYGCAADVCGYGLRFVVLAGVELINR